jgi:hypothetical protein
VSMIAIFAIAAGGLMLAVGAFLVAMYRAMR